MTSTSADITTVAETKIGAYICKGECLDTNRRGKAAFAKKHDILCSEAGVSMIKADIASSDVTHVMIAACSRRAKTEAFTFDNAAVGRANLRENVIWTRPDTEEARETTQEMAADYVRIGCAEAKYMMLVKTNPQAATHKRLLVVGGGVSGLTAAIEASKTSYPVTLIEKTKALGGWAAKSHKRVPQRAPYYVEAEDTGVDALIVQIKADTNISVLVNTSAARTDGASGNFDVTLATESGSSTTEVFGAIVQASGFTHYDANLLGEDYYRAGQDKGVNFAKGNVGEVVPGSGALTVKFKDLILNEDVALNADLVVLATGMVANAGVDIDKMTAPQVEGPASAAPADSVKPISILNLTYRQGPDLPQLKNGFADSHFICIPYETCRTGIYAAGPVRRPMDMLRAQVDATGAAFESDSSYRKRWAGARRTPAFGQLELPKFFPRRLYAV